VVGGDRVFDILGDEDDFSVKGHDEPLAENNWPLIEPGRAPRAPLYVFAFTMASAGAREPPGTPHCIGAPMSASHPKQT
jgi:hypothetical protein